MNLFFLYHIVEFIFLFLVFYKMSLTNKEEWFFTPIDKSLLIGSIVGLPLASLIGYIFYGLNGFYWGAIFGIVEGALAFMFVVLIFNFRNRVEIKKRNAIERNINKSKHK